MGTKKLLIGFFAMIACISMSAQEDLLWYFGEGQAGLRFDKSGGAPVVANEPAFVLYESVSVVSDCNGDVAFYTDGVKVYDASHSLMTNGDGLLGPQENNAAPTSGSSANGVLIVGDPSDTLKYYIFTVGETISGSVNGWRYHVVDMSLAGNGTVAAPLGEVISKNIVVHGPVAEGQSAVANTCGDSLWIVAHDYTSDTLLALPITAAGGVGALVKTKLGPTLSGGNGCRGSSDFSPNGEKYAMCYLWSATASGAYLFDFDFATGTFSNDLQVPGTGGGCYGVEFSFDNLSLYLGRWTLGNIEHYNIATNTVTTVGSPGGAVGDLERAPDGKIYVGKDAGNFLGVINTPDVADGPSSGYVNEGVDVGVKVEVGLPQMVLKPGNQLWNSRISVPYDLTTVCDKGGALQLTATPDCGAWTGGAFIDANGLFDPSSLATPGTYEVYYSVSSCIVPDTVEFTVEDCCPPLAAHGDQLCEGSSAFNVATLVDTGIGIWSLTSSPSGTGSVATLVDSVFDPSNYTKGSTYVTDGDYELTYTYWNAPLADCPDSTVVTIEIDSFPRDIFLGANSSLNQICDPTFEITAKSGLTYTWTAPLTGNSSSQTVSTNGMYYLSVVSPTENCPTEDSIEVEFDVAPTLIEQNDTVFCLTGSAVIGVNEAGLDYSWTPGNETTQNITVSTAGEYSVVVLSGPNGFCPSYDTVDVQIAPAISFEFLDLGDDTTACPGIEPLFISVLDDPNYDTFTWSMGTELSDTSVVINDFNEGDVVTLEIQNSLGCSGSDEITLHVFCEVKDPNVPNLFSPNTDGTNDSFTPLDFPPSEEGTYNALFPTSNFRVYDRWGLLMYEDTDYPEWDGKNKLKRDCSAGVYFWILETTDINGKTAKKNGFVHLIR